jgi:hypothetical protein
MSSLGSIVLWFSHILIRDQDSDRSMPLAVGWQAEPPAPPRSRNEALALASSVAARAAANPESFPELVQEYSEDVVTRAAGGSMGGLSASRMLVEPKFLDGLAGLKNGEVSRVIETSHGFEILLRRSPPLAKMLAARRLVVSYRGTHAPGSPTTEPERSREDAERLAQGIAREVRTDVRAFDRLLTQYPPSDDEPNGFIGVWTNLEPGPFEREREQLAALEPGAVSDPIDSPQGFEVFLRTAVPPSSEYAVQVIQFMYSTGASPEQPFSRESVRRLAQGVGGQVRKDPVRFEWYQNQYCCTAPERWSIGRRPEAAVSAISALPIGGVHATPLEYRSSFVIAKRIDDPTVAFPPITFDLPSPEGVDIARMASNYSGTAVQKLVRGLGNTAAEDLRLAAPVAERFKALHEQLALAFDTAESKATREQALKLFFEGLSSLLPADLYDRYRDIMTARATQQLMKMY